MTDWLNRFHLIRYVSYSYVPDTGLYQIYRTFGLILARTRENDMCRKQSKHETESTRATAAACPARIAPVGRKERCHDPGGPNPDRPGSAIVRHYNRSSQTFTLSSRRRGNNTILVAKLEHDVYFHCIISQSFGNTQTDVAWPCKNCSEKKNFTAKKKHKINRTHQKNSRSSEST